MKAIETRYKGYRFRSRLEARWAVFFDALEILWEYEHEGFELSDGSRYLLDFKLKVAGFDALWAEVKPEINGAPNGFDKAKRFYADLVSAEDSALSTASIAVLHLEGLPSLSVRCQNRWIYPCRAHFTMIGVGTKAPHDWIIEGVEWAVNAAKSARFEFGEEGICYAS